MKYTIGIPVTCHFTFESKNGTAFLDYEILRDAVTFLKNKGLKDSSEYQLNTDLGSINIYFDMNSFNNIDIRDME